VKILQITSRPVYPPDDGGKIVAYNGMKYSSLRGHNITMVSVAGERERIPELEKYCRWIPGQKKTRTSAVGLVSNLFSQFPYTITKYRDDWVRIQIEKLVQEKKFDIVHIDGLHTAYYGIFLKEKFGLPIVLRAYNVETEIMRNFYRNQKKPWIKLYAYLQYKKLYKYEAAICELFNKCIMITKDDEKKIKEMNARVRTCVIPAGVDTSYFYPLEIKEEPYSIISVASMDWLPNVESILWFCRDIFPLLKKQIRQAKLYIVGKNPPTSIKRLQDSDVVVTGFVEDVREYISRSAVFIVPLKTGSGIRVKILNAMAMARPIVSTSVGCQGIDVTDGKNIYVADDAEGFAGRVVDLLSDKEKRRQLGEEGLHLVEGKYRWPRIAEQMENQYSLILREWQK